MRQNLMPDDLMGAYVLAFAFQLVPEDLHEKYKEKLMRLIREKNYCIGTGFLATPFILDVLCDLGESIAAYRILFQENRPSCFTKSITEQRLYGKPGMQMMQLWGIAL